MKQERFSSLIGLTTSTGIKITGVSKHVVDRAVSRRFSANGAINALQNPLEVSTIKVDEKGRISQEFTGTDATIVVNPETGNIVTGWSKK